MTNVIDFNKYKKTKDEVVREISEEQIKNYKEAGDPLHDVFDNMLGFNFLPAAGFLTIITITTKTTK